MQQIAESDQTRVDSETSRRRVRWGVKDSGVSTAVVLLVEREGRRKQPAHLAAVTPPQAGTAGQCYGSCCSEGIFLNLPAGFVTEAALWRLLSLRWHYKASHRHRVMES
ncbi:hypothetical protein EYF80_030252 [Liparis tanakae]|uniref:Uncharacterized protein n=1 Tax=Liparis tanakae TaxID=230148 RepID=A0A4Z2H106_9TELE|nr:hypothetical protein EYF80_030252 [Liparis tanakae]